MQARSGKAQANKCLNMLRGSHITPIIDQYYLVLVGLSMLRDCSSRPLWESSFIAVNMHPEHRMGIEDWLDKIQADVVAADKFEREDLEDLESLLPPTWTKQSLAKRDQWKKIIKDGSESWDVDMIMNLRQADMTLSLLNLIYRVYSLEKRIAAKKVADSAITTTTITIATTTSITTTTVNKDTTADNVVTAKNQADGDQHCVKKNGRGSKLCKKYQVPHDLSPVTVL